MSRRATLAVFTAVAVGCSPEGLPDPGTQIGEEGDEAICEWVSTTDPLSFDVAEFVDATEMMVDDTFVFVDGSTADLSVEVITVGTATAATSEALPGVDPTLCEGERYQVDVDVIWSVDGHFDETFTATAWATLSGRSIWDATLDLDDVVGPDQPADIDPVAWQTVELIVTGEMRDGEVSGFATWSAQNGPNDSGRGEMVGEWGPNAGL